MQRSSFVIRVIALALAVLLPAESAHCAWMMSPVAKTSAGMRADHACCRAIPLAPSALPTPEKSTPDCACLSLPHGVTSVVSVTPAAPDMVQTGATLEVLVAPAVGPLVERGETDTSSPRPPRLAPHPLRGPPTIS